jgi:hypothetical protein
VKIEQSVPETSAYKIQTPVNYPEESIQQSIVYGCDFTQLLNMGGLPEDGSLVCLNMLEIY